jgi:hypothetical protein
MKHRKAFAAVLALAPALASRAARAESAFGPFEVTLRGGAHVVAPSSQALFAVVEVNLPFDRLFSPARRAWRGLAESPSNAAPPSAEAPDAAEAAPAETNPAEAGTAPEQPSSAPPPEPPVHHEVDPGLARAAVARALRVSRLDDTRRLDSLASRARASAALPELRLRGARSVDDSIRWSPTVADPYQTTRAGGVDWLLEARLGWRLDRLVFDDAEIQVERLRAQQRQERARLVEQVVRALVSWHQARRQLQDRLASDEDRLLAELEELEARARLDVLTDGWFSRAARPASR